MSKGDAERSSQPLQERIRTSFENAPVGMALVSVEPESLGRFMWVNRTLCEIAGLPEERLLGLHVASIREPRGRRQCHGRDQAAAGR